MLKLQAGMQIDLGGVGKEYAVDAAAGCVEAIAPGLSCLINFGGDVAVRNARRDSKPWRVGIESCNRIGTAARVVQLSRGASCSAAVTDTRTSWMLAPAGRCAMLLTP